MSDDEIRDLLDLGLDDDDPQGSGARGTRPGAHLSAEQLWSAGRRQRTRGRAWFGGVGAAAAAASILGIVWAQGLAGGEAGPPPPADGTSDTVPGPTVEVDDAGRGEPYFARFESIYAEHAEQLSGSSRPATLEDLQGTWDGPHGELLVVEDEQVILTIANCQTIRSSGTVTVDGRLSADEWEMSQADGPDCVEPDPAMPHWSAIITRQPLVSMDGGTLIISGLDGTTDEPRVYVAMSLGPVDETGFAWADVPSETGVTPLTLGRDVQLLTSGTGDATALQSISEIGLEDRPGASAAAQGGDVEALGYPGTCPLQLESSLRSDGVLLVGEPAPFVACAADSDAPLPSAEPSPAVLALLRSNPTVAFTDDTMVISGTIPESMLTDTPPPVDDTAPTSDPPVESADPTDDGTGGQTPTYRDDIPLVLGTPTVVVMSEGEWAPTGELTPLTEEAATGRRWLPVTTESDPPDAGADPIGDRGLSFDGTTWRIRDCGIDVRVRGWLQDGVLTQTGEPEIVDNPDPGAACVSPRYPEDWAAMLTGEPYLAVDGDILVISTRLGDGIQLEPVGMALAPQGEAPPNAEMVRPVEVEDLAAGLVEVPGQEAAYDIGVSDARDPRPGHSTTIGWEDGAITVDVGCAEPLTGPAWLSPSEHNQSVLRAALPEVPEACAGAAADDAELWRQLLAHGATLHHFADHVILDAWADPAVAGPEVLP
ncbi:hypothetical protein MWU75_12810 [Ornithinimicrobium sp. F0845]|uniref:hypothetical protein n=1 Tax=Ornithinimicrobium sp. F0845 TaxID=2926412 RepID=UPI001FF432C9|nr:hypothetical protein [Ornithinimicrobium sp. F0845]MCK0113023.1 hypothetical protein [Ornithinimicrobium sp. F0845]